MGVFSLFGGWVPAAASRTLFWVRACVEVCMHAKRPPEQLLRWRIWAFPDIQTHSRKGKLGHMEGGERGRHRLNSVTLWALESMMASQESCEKLLLQLWAVACGHAMQLQFNSVHFVLYCRKNWEKIRSWGCEQRRGGAQCKNMKYSRYG